MASALAGVASGARSFTGLAAVVLATRTTRPGTQRQPDRLLGKPATKAVVGLAASQELVMDKLPKTPERTQPLGLSTRTFGAATSAVVIACRVPAQTDPPVTTANEPLDSGTGLPPADLAGDPDPAGVDPNDKAVTAVLVAGCVVVALAGAAVSAATGVRFRAWADRRKTPSWVSAVAEDAIAASLAVAAAKLVA